MSRFNFDEVSETYDRELMAQRKVELLEIMKGSLALVEQGERDANAGGI